MNDIAARARQAEALWAQADRAMAAANHADAYRLYTEAHDLVTDCPDLHRRSHERLQVINRLTGNWREYLGDRFLLLTAPLGVFQLVAFFLRSRVIGSELCRCAA